MDRELLEILPGALLVIWVFFRAYIEVSHRIVSKRTDEKIKEIRERIERS